MSYHNNDNNENIRQFDEEVSRLLDAKNRADQDKAQCERDMAQLNRDIERLQAEARRRQNIARDLRNITFTLEETRETLRELQRKCSNIESDYEHASKQLRTARREGHLHTFEVNRLRETNRRYEEEMNSLRQRLLRQQGLIERLRDDLEVAERRRRTSDPLALIGAIVQGAVIVGVIGAIIYGLFNPVFLFVLGFIGIAIGLCIAVYLVFKYM